MPRVSVPQIEGLTPAIDAKRTQRPVVMEGRNFIVDVDGPRSAFGFECAFDTFDPLEFPQSFTIGNSIFYFTRDKNETVWAISKVSWLKRQIVPYLQLAASNGSRPKLDFPWSHAFVGTYHFFANRTFGVLRYDAITQAWDDVTATLGIANVFHIVQSAGRLICMAEGIVSWSAIDDGMDNTPSTTTGAGFQSISLVGTLESDEDYLGLYTVSAGFIAITGKGVLRGDIIDSQIPFRFRPIESRFKPLTPWTAVKISDSQLLILATQGFYSTEDGVFVDWQPLFGEFIKKEVLRGVDGELAGNIALSYSVLRDEIYASFADPGFTGIYNRAYVLYLKRDSWGLMNRVHRGFVEIDEFNRNLDYKFAFVDLLGKVCHLNDSVNLLKSEPVNDESVYVRELLQVEAKYVDGVARLPSRGNWNTHSKKGIETFTGFLNLSGILGTGRTEVTAALHDSLATYWLNLKSDPSTAQFGDDSIQNSRQYFAPNIADTFEFKVRFEIYGDRLGYKVNLHYGDQNLPTVIRDIDISMDSVTFEPTILIPPADDAVLQNFAIVQVATKSYELTFDIVSQGGYTATPAYISFFRISVSDIPYLALTANEFEAQRVFEMSWKGSDGVDISAWAGTIEAGDLNGFAAAQWLSSGNRAFITAIFDGTLQTANESGTFNAGYIIIGKSTQAIVRDPIDSEVTIGTLRLTEELAGDELSIFTNVGISCLAPPENVTDIPWDLMNNFSSDVATDLAINEVGGDTFKDLGLELVSGSVYTQSIIGTLDGYKEFEGQDATLTEVVLDGKTKFCTCINNGIYHNLKVEAKELGQSYHIKLLEFTGALSGRL